VQRDYILRQIEMLGAVLRRIRDLIRRGATEQAAGELSDAARHAGMDLGMAKSLSAETLLTLLSIAGEPDVARCMLFAEVLNVDGIRAEAEGADAEARDAFGKALLLFETVQSIAPAVMTDELRAKIREIADRLTTPR